MTATSDTNVNRGPFPTEAEAREHKPANDKQRLFRVTAPDGRVAFAWANTGDSALTRVARAHGYTAGSVGKAPTREKVAGLLGQLSPEDQALLIAQFVPPPAGGAPAPAADKPPAAGKKGGK
jgi:hypothetical protein